MDVKLVDYSESSGSNSNEESSDPVHTKKVAVVQPVQSSSNIQEHSNPQEQPSNIIETSPPTPETTTQAETEAEPHTSAVFVTDPETTPSELPRSDSTEPDIIILSDSDTLSIRTDTSIGKCFSLKNKVILEVDV